MTRSCSYTGGSIRYIEGTDEQVLAAIATLTRGNVRRIEIDTLTDALAWSPLVAQHAVHELAAWELLTIDTDDMLTLTAAGAARARRILRYRRFLAIGRILALYAAERHGGCW